MSKSSVIIFIDNALIFLWGFFLLVFPFLISTSFTNIFTLPKEIIFVLVILLSLLLWGIKIAVSEKVVFRRTAFDFPVILFLLALLLSSLFAVNRADSLIATIPVILAGIGYFIITNAIKKQHNILFIVSSLLVGGAGLAILSVFSYLKVYPLLFQFTHVQYFTPLGSLIEQAFYFIFLLGISLSLSLPILKGKTDNKTVAFATITLIFIAGLIVTISQLFTTQKPFLLSFETGFQTAFAAISQDTGRIAQGFLFGSGFGNFSTVFTRFKQASFNSSPYWANQFTNSSSFILEILATSGVIGMLSYLFLLFKVLTPLNSKKTNPIYFAILAFAVISLFLPYSFIEISLLFILLALFSALSSLKDTKNFYDVELKFVALKNGMISLTQISLPSEKHELNKPTAFVVTGIFLAIVLVAGWWGVAFVSSDIIFQKSLVEASVNNGTATYQDQAKAITTFPYRSTYYSVFAQTNIALANSLASLQRGGTPSASTQNTLYTLIQQGINAGKTATSISPQSVGAWQNLSSVYRALIGTGQNAESFAILASQQAIVLDSTNPQEFVALGGLYYQLGQWDSAIRQFQQAIILKGDYPNAYYNLGHAYEQKGDYQNALSNYQAVAQLVVNDPNNYAKIKGEIAALQNKMHSSGSASNQAAQTANLKTSPAPTSQPLNLSGQNPAGQSASPGPTK